MSILKSWLLPALFFLVSLPTAAADAKSIFTRALEVGLAENETWHSLLHLKGATPQITDDTFLLSGKNFSVQNELRETINFFVDNPEQAKCRFPARLLFLNKHLTLSGLDLNSSPLCPELTRYQQYVPFDEVNLIFASEVLSSASSMMGHTFLNITGKNVNETQV